MFQTSIPKVERNFNKDLTVCWTSPSGCVLGMSVSVCLQMDCLHPYICSSPLFPVPWNSSATLSVAQTFDSFPPMYTVYHQAPLIVTQTCLSVPLPFSEPLATTLVPATSTLASVTWKVSQFVPLLPTLLLITLLLSSSIQRNLWLRLLRTNRSSLSL